MKTYVARRLLALIPVGLVVATVAFLLMHLAPGRDDLGSSIFLRKPVTEAILDRVNLVGVGLQDLLDPKIRSLQTDRQRAA